MRPRTMMLTIVCSIALAGLFGSGLQLSSGQQGVRMPGCACFVCGNMQVEASKKGWILPFNFLSLEEPNCEAGILAEAACPEVLSKMPREKVDKFCNKLKTGLKFNSFKESCPILAKTCEPDGPSPPPETKCDPPRSRDNNPPWFEKNAPCQNRQKGTYSWGRNRRDQKESVTVSICGQIIRFVHDTLPEQTSTGVRSFDVCCDTWQNAAGTGSPCDVRRDIDCDGKLNETDLNPISASRDKATSDDFVSKSPLSNLPFWKQLYESMPSQSGCKDCKWELIKVDYTCKEKVVRTGTRSDRIDAEYEYEATWSCPTNGQTEKAQDSASMIGLRCPTPQSRSWP